MTILDINLKIVDPETGKPTPYFEDIMFNLNEGSTTTIITTDEDSFDAAPLFAYIGALKQRVSELEEMLEPVTTNGALKQRVDDLEALAWL